MNPILQEALGSLVRWVLTIGAGYLVSQGIWSQDDASKYVTAGVVGVLTLGWSVWQKYKSRSKLLVALGSSAPMSELQAEIKVSQARTPPMTVPKDEVPVLAPTPKAG